MITSGASQRSLVNAHRAVSLLPITALTLIGIATLARGVLGWDIVDEREIFGHVVSTTERLGPLDFLYPAAEITGLAAVLTLPPWVVLSLARLLNREWSSLRWTALWPLSLLLVVAVVRVLS